MSPLEKYRQDLCDQGFFADPAQQYVVQKIDALFVALLADYATKDRLLARIRRKFQRQGKFFIKGLYLWGGVGRGKTYVVDSFYDCLPFAEKKRLHFYHFMQLVHQRLRQIGDVSEPLQIVADGIASETGLLCLDEFHVHDIADAMLLGGLLKALFERRVVILMTSNDAPEHLYKDGLQRERFLPVIDLIAEYMQVLAMGAGADYRLRFLERADVYHRSLDDKAMDMLQLSFSQIACHGVTTGMPIKIQGRMITTVRCADGIIWFDFDAICGAPRGYADYIEIAKLFHTVMVAGTPVMDETMNDEARRFVALIDELYDQNVKLIMTAAAEPVKLYTGKRLTKVFLRTVSRLEEMHTHDYLARAHCTKKY